jgi:hypothetical protein
MASNGKDEAWCKYTKGDDYRACESCAEATVDQAGLEANKRGKDDERRWLHISYCNTIEKNMCW